ncbi:hypothetical protein WICMUC_002894 [Wickerhamomyces mucosus]|uniref:Uncharacterized protein n=1 Tax=Wickerhamomyces mucosus TaxID=1378264 RepID=A0A9P8PMZ2_9ASCO|nr:hypothetical protein WICMUC_002894 [Wickerhamomyces mucosus]
MLSSSAPPFVLYFSSGCEFSEASNVAIRLIDFGVQGEDLEGDTEGDHLGLDFDSIKSLLGWVADKCCVVVLVCIINSGLCIKEDELSTFFFFVPIGFIGETSANSNPSLSFID